MDGIINLLKCTGMTSSDAVVRARRITGEKRIGHGGTLDPAAAGVLPLLVGRATRLFDEITDKEKTYIAEFIFGRGTDTLDGDGTVTATGQPAFTRSDLSGTLPRFTGSIEQQPPMYSAIKVGGRKLADLARKGRSEEIPVRNVLIRSFTILDQRGPYEYMMEIQCSRGTYIRSLCRDVAESLGTCGYVSYLLRTQAGPYLLGNAVTLEQLEFHWKSGAGESLLGSMDEPLAHLPAVKLPPGDEAKLRNGQSVAAQGLPPGKDTVRLYGTSGFLGTGRIIRADGRNFLKIKTMLERRET